ncbi:amino acid transporter-like protein [Aureobasidium pullulans]|nr:amino acid transporter-like protein [Aureobasidium pullulans]
MYFKQPGVNISPSFVSDGEKNAAVMTVPPRFRGTHADQKDMAMLGKPQELRRNFRFVTMLGFASTVMSSWELLLPLWSFVLTDGGTPILFWGFIVVGFIMGLVYASIAELASMSPTSGGQYHWVSECAPVSVRKLLSYTTGWLCAIGWQVYLAGVCFMIGRIIQGLMILNLDSYDPQPWHVTLITIAVAILAIMFNTVLAEQLPVLEGVALLLHMLGFFAIIIPLWVMGPRRNSYDTLLNFTNNGGWPSTSLSAMIGMSASPLSVLIGFDCSVHMGESLETIHELITDQLPAEEIRDASITLPKAMVWSVGPNALMAFLMGVTLSFTVGNPDAIAMTPTNEPFIQIFFNATNSHGATNAMCATIIIMLMCNAVSEVATASRQIWSFARDGGLPCSKWLATVTPGWNIPIRAVSVSLVVTSAIACINLGSSAALNAINSLGGVAILTSYIVAISALIWRRLYGAPLPRRRWSLGQSGLWINIAAVALLLPVWFFMFWPLAQPVTATDMNWSSTMFGGVMIIALVYYAFKGKHEYIEPVLLIKRD